MGLLDLKVSLGIVPFFLLDGTELQATQLHDYFAFNCPCGNHPPLMANHSRGFPQSEVDCPSCKRRYKVKFTGGFFRDGKYYIEQMRQIT